MREQTFNSIMPTFVRASVDELEKANTKKRAEELGMNEAELVRAGLKMMGVSIAVEKHVGAPAGNQNKKKKEHPV
jgi:serine/threonine protein kinase HipA of HipAB toxin-antitoxin module